MRAVLTLLGFAALFYFAAIAIVWALQAKFVYYPGQPTRQLQATPARIGLDFEDVQFETGDGVRLHGWFVPGPSQKTVLYFPGNAGNISHRLAIIRLLHDLGLAVMIVDYRGYGRSGGKPGEQGTYRDALAAWRYLTVTRGTDAASIVIYGRSLGGGVASWLATRVDPAGLILESTFTSIEAMACTAYPWIPAGLSRIHYDTLSRIASIRCPILLLHSREDRTIPYEHAESLQAAAGDNARLVTLAGDHNETHAVSGERFTDALHEFVSEIRAAGPG